MNFPRIEIIPESKFRMAYFYVAFIAFVFSWTIVVFERIANYTLPIFLRIVFISFGIIYGVIILLLSIQLWTQVNIQDSIIRENYLRLELENLGIMEKLKLGEKYKMSDLLTHRIEKPRNNLKPFVPRENKITRFFKNYSPKPPAHFIRLLELLKFDHCKKRT